jgi:hypothetical protein
MSVYPPYWIMNGWTNLYETWYVYQSTCVYPNSVIQKSLPSLIPTVQPLIFLRQNLNIAWKPVPIFIKLGMHIMSHEATSTAYFIYLLDH